MDLRNVLPKIECSIKMNPNEFLTWSLDIMDNSNRYGLACVFKYFYLKYMKCPSVDWC